jgi:prevent-host-death family protein
MTKTLPITKAREKFTSIVENANKLLDKYVITVNGTPSAVIMSSEEYESWQETNEILSNPELLKAIKKGEKELKEGKGVSWEDVKKHLDLN